MSANAYAEDVEEALKSGMNAHVAKPIDVHRLFEVMYQYCNENK
jgi:CheY-like chemotaxis protein